MTLLQRLFLILLSGATTVTHAADIQSGSTGGVLQVLFGLIFVLGLMAAAAWLLKRFGAARIASSGATARVIGGVSVGGRERVVVVEIADQWIVVGVAPGRVNALTTMPRQEVFAAPAMPPISKNFSTWLKQTIEKRNGN